MSLGVEPAPPPSAELLLQVARARAVRTRRPRRELALTALALSVPTTWAFVTYPLREDLRALPAWWMWLAGLVWAAAFAGLLTRALLPPAGEVLPDARRAARATAVTTLVLVGFGLAFTVDAACCTILPAQTWTDFGTNWWHCISFGLRVTGPALIVGGLLIRRMAGADRGRLGMAVGAAGGALAGFVLNLLCPYGGGLHVGLAHGGGVAVGAVLGALLVHVAGRRTRRERL